MLVYLIITDAYEKLYNSIVLVNCLILFGNGIKFVSCFPLDD